MQDETLSDSLQTRIDLFEKKLIHRPRPLVMGVLNTTPDSFSDGGSYTQLDIAFNAAVKMIEQGADIIDIGGESTRPGAEEVPVEVELERVLPLVQLCHKAGIPVSVDTSKAQVMKACAEVGVVMLNDVNGFRGEGIADVLAALSNASLTDHAVKKIFPFLCLMHMQDQPRTMQQAPVYNSLFDDINAFFASQISFLTSKANIDPQRIVLDPGFGFGKTDEHNWDMLKHLDRFNELGYPILAGLSRKSMFGRLLNRQAHERMPASLASALIAAQNGARIIRVHDVAETVDVLKVYERITSNF